MSLLGDMIKAHQSKVMENDVPLILNHFMSSAKSMCCEINSSMDEFECYVCADDYKNEKRSSDVWEALCETVEAFSPLILAEVVGIVVEFKGSREATIKWSKV